MGRITNIVFRLSLVGLVIVSALFINALFVFQQEDTKEEPSILASEIEPKETEFKKKDIIKEINNRKVASSKDDIKIYRNTTGQLKRPPALHLEITPERKGKLTPLKYNAVN